MPLNIRFGPAGLGSIKDAVSNLEEFHKLGIRACEIAFTYGVYIKNKEDAELIANAAKKLDIKLSIHAPYWINLNSKEKKKIDESKQRILDCCKVGQWLKAYRVVFHPGFYGGMDKEETYQSIKREILEMQSIVKKNKLTQLAPETTGKINVFGSVDEISRLMKETGCRATIDFAHILAREKKVNHREVLEKLSDNSEQFHIHFSGIVYGEKGEIRHQVTKETEISELLGALKRYAKGKDIVIINESPDPVKDSLKGIKILQKNV